MPQRDTIPPPLPTYEIKVLIRNIGVANFLEFYKTRHCNNNKKKKKLAYNAPG